MTLPACDAEHRCADGGKGKCKQPKEHYGRHLCGACMAFFGAGEATAGDSPSRNKPVDREIVRHTSSPSHILGSSELEQELAFIDAKLADLNLQLESAYQEAAATKEKAAAMHRAAEDLMQNPDTREQGLEMEERARAMEGTDLDRINRLIESLSNMIKSLQEQKQAIIRQIG